MAAPADERKIFLNSASTVGRTTFFSRTTALAEQLKKITTTCIQALEGKQEIAEHHRIVAEWVVRYCSALGLSPFAIRDPDSWQHQNLLKELKRLPSPYVKALQKKMKQTPWEPLPELILNGAFHEKCSICELAQRVRIAIRERILGLLSLEDQSFDEVQGTQNLTKAMKKWKSCKKLSDEVCTSLAQITTVFIEKLKAQQEGCHQHRTMVEWVVHCSRILGDISYAPMKDLSSWIQRSVSNSPYVAFFSAQMHPERPPLGLSFENVLHRECVFCETAQEERMKAENEFSKLLFPREQLRGPVATPLQRLLPWKLRVEE